MAVDLADLVPNLRIELSPPGEDLDVGVTDDELIDRLSNAFWNARLDGLLQGYVESNGIVTPVSGTEDLSRDLQQVIVFLAAYNALHLQLLSQRTNTRYKAGSVEYETQQSAQVLKDLAASLRDRYLMLLGRLSDLGVTTDLAIDAVIARSQSIGLGDSWWVGA